MKKYEYEIAGLDCAACANEIQEGLNKNPEIKNANVNFAKMKLTYETDTLSSTSLPDSPSIISAAQSPLLSSRPAASSAPVLSRLQDKPSA